MNFGAHIHHINIMAPVRSGYPDLAIGTFISPAISPIYSNNPGYGWLELDNNSLDIDSYKFRFFQLEDYYQLGVITY